MKRVVLLVLALLAAPVLMAQDTAAGRLGRSIGKLLFHDRAAEDRAYQQGAMQGAIDRALIEDARRNAAEADLLEQTRQIQIALRDRFVQAGIPGDEAAAMASAYRITPDESAIIARARREGSARTGKALGQAYAVYNYLPVDQLTIGYLMALQDGAKAASP